MYKRITLLFMLPVLAVVLGSISNNISKDAAVIPERVGPGHPLFAPSRACMSCHNGIVTPSGEDISFGIDWRASMMANSARDPYWHAAVRREIMDHPESQSMIENECSTCHMPMSHFEAVYNGEKAKVFEHLPISKGNSRADMLAADGVSCTTCHQITEKKLGTYESFVGRFGMDTLSPLGKREVFGPYPVDEGLSNIMHSSSGFWQAESKHIQLSEVCATCHTLYTKTLGPGGEVIGELPEQVPYLEWRHSRFVDEKSCQSCHMPVVEQKVAISSVMGQPREEVSRHSFRGGNFFMLKMLNRYRNDLGVVALPNEMTNAVNRTVEHLQTRSARLELRNVEVVEGQLRAEVLVSNRAGHKLPTAYPSRRAWIYLRLSDESGNVLFESGSLRPDGSITGNDNDRNARTYEPHFTEISESEQVQIYETIMVDPDDSVTTGLLNAVRFIKDNRILPDGFDKTTAEEDIAVQGQAYEDNDFLGGSDKVTYTIDISGTVGPLHIKAELWYQPIGFRWAQNLAPYDSRETNRFVSYYDSMSDESAIKLAGVKDTWWSP